MEIVERPTQLNTEVHTYILRALGLQGQGRAQHERLLTTECFIASKENIYPNPNLAYYTLMRTVSQSKTPNKHALPSDYLLSSSSVTSSSLADVPVVPALLICKYGPVPTSLPFRFATEVHD